MNELIDTKLVAKLMNEVAKECGMTRDDSCNVSQTLWWAKEVQMIDRGAILPINYNYRYITKTYDFVADNFLKLLAKRVEAEGFDLADNEPKVTTSKSMWYDYSLDASWEEIKKAPKVKGPLHGSQYIRMTVAWKGYGSEESREKHGMDPINKKWYLENIEFIKTMKEKGK